MANRLAFVPFQAETADAFRASIVVVHASTQPEPFGRTIVEAMACSRPVIVANAGGESPSYSPKAPMPWESRPAIPMRCAQAMDRLIDNETTRPVRSENVPEQLPFALRQGETGRDIADVYTQVAPPPLRITFLNPIGRWAGPSGSCSRRSAGPANTFRERDWRWCCSPAVRSRPRPPARGGRDGGAAPGQSCGTRGYRMRDNGRPRTLTRLAFGRPRWVMPRRRSGSSGGCGRPSAGPRPDLIHSNGLKAHVFAAMARPRGFRCSGTCMTCSRIAR